MLRDNAEKIIVAAILIIMISLMVGIFYGNPFATQYAASVIVKDKTVGAYRLKYATIEFLSADNGNKVGDRRLMIVNPDDAYAQMVVGEECDVQIRADRITYAYHVKRNR
jgi:uncharacterized protein YneF (UPF0154 family)